MIPNLQVKDLVSRVPISNKLLNYFAAHSESFQRIWHCFSSNNIIHKAGVQISLEGSHSEQHYVFVFLGQSISQNSVTSPVNHTN